MDYWHCPLCGLQNNLEVGKTTPMINLIKYCIKEHDNIEMAIYFNTTEDVISRY